MHLYVGKAAVEIMSLLLFVFLYTSHFQNGLPQGSTDMQGTANLGGLSFND